MVFCQILSDDPTDFMVYGVLGGEAVGKSTLLSAIAESLGMVSSLLFPRQTEQSLANGTWTTSGVDVIVVPSLPNASRSSILIDTQVSWKWLYALCSIIIESHYFKLSITFYIVMFSLRYLNRSYIRILTEF